MAAGPDLAILFVGNGERLALNARAGAYLGRIGDQQRWFQSGTLAGERLDVTFCLDDDGRVSVEVYVAFATSNDASVSAEVTITLNGRPQSLWGQVPRSLTMTRSTLWRWESYARRWHHDRIPALVRRGVLLRHDLMGLGRQPGRGLWKDVALPLPPFGLSPGRLRMQANPSGGERPEIGLVHEFHAHLIRAILDGEEERFAQLYPSIKSVAENIGQFRDYFFMRNGRVVDPASPEHSWHANYAATEGAQVRIRRRGSWDLAHPMNSLLLPSLLTDDPYYLLLAQLNAVAAIGYGTALNRPPGYTGVVVAEERGFWWGLRALWWAEQLTPDGHLPDQFLPRRYFTRGIEQTWDYLRQRIQARDVHGSIRRFWGTVSTFVGTDHRCVSNFQLDYGNQVLLWMRLAGRAVPDDILDWKLQSIVRRVQLGGHYINGVDGLDYGISTAVTGKNDDRLPYADNDGYHAWMTAERAKAGLPPMRRDVVPIHFSGATHRNLQLALGVLQMMTHAGVKTAIDPQAEFGRIMRGFVDREGKRVMPPFPGEFYLKNSVMY